MNTLTPPTALVHRFPLLFFLLLVFPGTTPSVRAEKLQITITQVLPLVNTDAGGTAGDHADVYVHLTITPQGGTPLLATSPVVVDVLPQQKVLQGYSFPVFSVQPRPVRIAWEIRDRDTGDDHVMDQGLVNIPNNDEPWTGGSPGFTEAIGEFKAQWVPDWANLFGLVCDGENGCLDLQAVADKITDALDSHPNVIKFGFRLSLGLVHLEHAEGLKRSAADAPAMANFGMTDRFNPASVTKAFTAVAMLRAMDQEGVGLDQPIAPWLPSYWTKGPSTSNITFRQVLAHTSGIRGSVSTFAQLRTLIAAGVSPSDKVYFYANANYNLCRILLATIKGYQPINAISDTVGVSVMFTTFMNEELLAPLGIPNAAWEPNLANGALFYPHATGQPLSQLNGTGFKNRTLSEGSGGIQLSLREMSLLFTRMWISGQFLSKPMLDKMKELEMGGRMLSDPVDGPAFVKGGGYPLAGYGAEESRCVVRFGNGLTAVVMINGGVNAFETLIAAYNSSWYEPAAQPAHHQAVSRLSAAAMQLAQRIPAPELESVMASLHPLPGSVLYFDPLGLLRLVPDWTRTNVLLTWDAASDPRVLDTLYRSSDLRRWSVVGTFPGRVGGGVLEDLQLISGRGGYFRVGRARRPDTDSLIDVLNRAPAAIPFAGSETTLSRDLIATGLTLRGFAADRSTSRTSWPPLIDKPPIRLQIDSD